MQKSLIGTVATMAVLLSMMFVSVAPAQVGFVGGKCTITQDAYGPGICEDPPPPPPNTIYRPKLPFTGADMGLAALIGAMLLGGGIAMRRATARDVS